MIIIRLSVRSVSRVCVAANFTVQTDFLRRPGTAFIQRIVSPSWRGTKFVLYCRGSTADTVISTAVENQWSRVGKLGLVVVVVVPGFVIKD